MQNQKPNGQQSSTPPQENPEQKERASSTQLPPNAQQAIQNIFQQATERSPMPSNPPSNSFIQNLFTS